MPFNRIFEPFIFAISLVKRFLFHSLGMLCALSFIVPNQTLTAQPFDRPEFLKEDVTYTWPTNAGRYLSSTFGETRSAHLHTGIDIKTWGKEGYDVYATRDGVLYRVQTGPSGYGNALYLRHNDGSYSVYAHLRNFIPEITDLVDSVRVPILRHDVDILVIEQGLRFKKGERIAFTGSTGIGPPHLHFELRSPDNVPYNPLYANFEISDRQAPSISSLLIEEVTNEFGAVTRRRQIERRATYGEIGIQDFGNITTAGSLLLSVDASDRADDVTNVYAVYQLKLFVGDSLLFESRASRLPFETSSHMFVDRHYEWLRNRRKGFQRLHLLQGNKLPLYTATPSEGIVSLPEGNHLLTIIAQDFFGNETKGILQVEQIQDAGILKLSEVPTLNTSSVQISNSRENTGGEKLRELFGDLLKQVDTKLSKTIVIDTLLYPDQAYFLETPDRRFFLDIPREAIFEPFRLTFSVSRTSDQELVFLVSPNPVPFAEPVRFGLLLDPPVNTQSTTLKTGLAWLSDKPIATGRSSSGRWLTFSTLEVGPFSTYSDSISPNLSKPRRVNLPEGISSVEFKVTNEESPLNRLSAEFRINGVEGISIYDPEYKSFRFYHPEVSLSNSSTITFSVADQLGNRTATEWLYQNGVFTPLR